MLDVHVTQTLIAYIFVIFGHFREELKEKYEGKISQEMDGPIYEIVSRLMKAVVGRRITGNVREYILCTYECTYRLWMSFTQRSFQIVPKKC